MDIDIAIPTFGRAAYLKQTLDSLPLDDARTHVYVSDGGSSFDKSAYPAANWRRLDPDPGLVPCWNDAANHGDSPYLAFLADDNGWHTDALTRMQAMIDEYPQADVWFGRQDYVDQNGEPIPGQVEAMDRQFGRDQLSRGYLDEAQRLIALKFNSVPTEACMLRRSAWERLGGFAPQADLALDWHLMLKAIALGMTIAYDPAVWMWFRLHNQAVSTRAIGRQVRGEYWALCDAEKYAQGEARATLHELIYGSALNQLRHAPLNARSWLEVARNLIRSPGKFIRAACNRLQR